MSEQELLRFFRIALDSHLSLASEFFIRYNSVVIYDSLFENRHNLQYAINRNIILNRDFQNSFDHDTFFQLCQLSGYNNITSHKGFIYFHPHKPTSFDKPRFMLKNISVKTYFICFALLFFVFVAYNGSTRGKNYLSANV